MTAPMMKEKEAETRGPPSRDMADFMHLFTHDLKAPVRRILSFCAILKEDAGDRLPPEAASHIDIIVKNAERLQRMVEDTAAFARAAAAPEDKTVTDLDRLLAGVLDYLEPLIAETGGEVAVGKMPAVAVYPLAMKQLFRNLVGNALRHHGEAAPAVTVDYENKGGRHVFTVADNGPGIAPEYHELIFKPFHKLKGSQQTGLGLALCRAVAEKHGGDIRVESAPGQGAKFIVSLPG